MRNTFLLLALLFGLTYQAKSTCIVIFLKDNKIYVGADSRRTVNRIDAATGALAPIYESICKIHKGNKFYYAVSGYNDALSDKLANESTLQGKGLENVVDLFINKIKRDHIPGLEETRRRDGDFFKKRFTTNDVGAVSFFGYENNIAKLITIAFRVIINKNNKLEVVAKKFNEVAAFLGVHDKIDSQSHQQLTALYSKGVVYTIKSLIKLQIDADPKSVGYPVDILELTTKGENWIQRKKLCQ